MCACEGHPDRFVPSFPVSSPCVHSERCVETQETERIGKLAKAWVPNDVVEDGLVI